MEKQLYTMPIKQKSVLFSQHVKRTYGHSTKMAGNSCFMHKYTNALRRVIQKWLWREATFKPVSALFDSLSNQCTTISSDFFPIMHDFTIFSVDVECFVTCLLRAFHTQGEFYFLGPVSFLPTVKDSCYLFFIAVSKIALLNCPDKLLLLSYGDSH
jgi:hypothetical protein